MGERELGLGGAEDDFHDRFAAELEVLAELEGLAAGSPRRERWAAAGRAGLTPEDAEAGGAAARPPAGGRPGSRGGAGVRRLAAPSPGDAALPPTPRVKRPRLQVVRELNFRPEEPEEPPGPDSPAGDITPPPSPEVPPELWPEGPSDAAADGGLLWAPGAARNPVLRRPPVLEDYVSVTSTAGSRAFLVLRADPVGTGVQMLPPRRLFFLECLLRDRPVLRLTPFRDTWWRGQGRLDLLGVSFASLKEQVDSERRQQLLQEAHQLSDTLRSLRSEEVEEEVQPLGAPEEELANSPDGSQHCLWVDEFAPQYYTELLSDDFTNRCLLKWLKLWDPVVFGRERPARKPRPSMDLARGGKEATTSSKWKSHEQVLEDMLEADLDPSRRPRQKVALLCGPPGLGKTTLAHVIARHAGYSVVEMNASDDRSPEAFRTCIEAATQMESVLGAGGKPNCLVIDEIDGAPVAAINVLLNVLDRKGPQDAESGGPGVPTSGGRRHRADGGLLMRPIICICNDQFVPSLRQLRQQAFLLHFPPILSSRLTQRLQEISLRQGMQADPGALAALCEKTDNDIRACINTLQFLHGRGRRELSVRAVQTTRVGLKDQRKGLFSVWQEIFQLPRAQRQRWAQDPSSAPHMLLLGDAHLGPGPRAAEAPLTTAAQRLHRILHVAASAGEHEKVVQGLFDNFLRLRLRDSSLGTVCTALDWLAFDDLLTCTAHHGQSFQLLRYLPFLPAAFHLLFASSHVPRIAFPSSQQEAQSRTSRTQNLIHTLVAGIAPATRSRATPQALILDALCLILDILAPKLRPVSTQLYSTREKQQLASLVGTMLAYSLTYRQERRPDGQYIYRLEPNVEEVCRFPELPARKPLTYQAKQLIAHEIEMEKMRRAEALARVGDGPQVDRGPPGATAPLGGAGEKEAQPPTSHSQEEQWLEQRLERILKKAALEEQPERDFFGRVVTKRAAPLSAGAVAPETDVAERRIGRAVGRSDVWFRFKEGVSNAVRRRVPVRDLL
ncbi:chromosome transmission fidelity protein 18 homolog isoform X1 [Canis lupus familiaris]|nr:chromosome transmission fidelity protein 18 homolog isoform X1 [Canis lupus dingo]XP_038396791.1 chromosome transmission fidelity protein 18 homolog isoform X1 [Canis lupus familiaris]XP_038406789.1 chromosome transmission fidelity protein 18 homolog isoform X1 [Canis lupus familiaris]XP_038525592.1 chromosome transmission fidelity protein 18 homolog isoform X1 [Canis lupus familiaris]